MINDFHRPYSVNDSDVTGDGAWHFNSKSPFLWGIRGHDDPELKRSYLAF